MFQITTEMRNKCSTFHIYGGLLNICQKHMNRKRACHNQSVFESGKVLGHLCNLTCKIYKRKLSSVALYQKYILCKPKGILLFPNFLKQAFHGCKDFRSTTFFEIKNTSCFTFFMSFWKPSHKSDHQ